MTKFNADFHSGSFSGERRLTGADLAQIGLLASLALMGAPAAGQTKRFLPVNQPPDEFHVIHQTSTSSYSIHAEDGRSVGTGGTYRGEAPGLWEALVAQASWVDAAAKRIQHLASKHDGWRGAESVAPSAGAIADALFFLEKLQMETPDAGPMISLDDEGEFIFFWRSASGVASAVLDGSGTFIFYGKRGLGEDVLGEDVPLADPLPTELVHLLSGLQEPDL